MTYPQFYFCEKQYKVIKLDEHNQCISYQVHKDRYTGEENIVFRKCIIPANINDVLAEFTECTEYQYKEVIQMYFLKNKEYYQIIKEQLLKNFSIFKFEL